MLSLANKIFSRRNPKLVKSRVQILSDLHLEVGQQYSLFTFPVSAPYLVLAGDIGRLVDYEGYLLFLSRQTERYDRIFLVLGNHEFYGSDHQSGIDKAQALVKEPVLSNKVTLLHRRRWDDPRGGSNRLTILGCTLWSSVPDESRDIVGYKIRDFRKIAGWSVAEHNKQHREDAKWLCDELGIMKSEGDHTGRVLVVTHHAPAKIGTSEPQHANNPWSSAFSTDILATAQMETGLRAGTWVFGHTHYSTDFVLNGLRIVANQRGYVFPGSATAKEARAGDKMRPKRPSRHEFEPSFTIDI